MLVSDRFLEGVVGGLLAMGVMAGFVLAVLIVIGVVLAFVKLSQIEFWSRASRVFLAIGAIGKVISGVYAQLVLLPLEALSHFLVTCLRLLRDAGLRVLSYFSIVVIALVGISVVILLPLAMVMLVGVPPDMAMGVYASGLGLGLVVAPFAILFFVLKGEKKKARLALLSPLAGSYVSSFCLTFVVMLLNTG